MMRTQHNGALRVLVITTACALTVLLAPGAASQTRDVNPAMRAASPSIVSVPAPPVTARAARQFGLLPELSLRRVLVGRLGRMAVYGALFIAIGAIGISAIAVPRIRRSNLDPADAFPTMLDGMALTVGVVAGFMLALSTLLRTILQFTDSVEAKPGLTFAQFIGIPGQGRSLVISTLVGGVVAISAALARQHRTSEVWRTVEIAAVVLFLFFWASSGHAATATSFFGVSAVVPLMIHVIAAGLWIGSLAVIFVTVLPLALSDTSRLPLLRATVWSFSGMALMSAAIMVLTGILNALAQMGDLSRLTTTRYGLTLLIKLGFVVLLFLAGAYNWRVVRLQLHDIAGALRLRGTIRMELFLAAFVLLFTSALVATDVVR